jgi:PhzF family phenazine biosynthesis protein
LVDGGIVMDTTYNTKYDKNIFTISVIFLILILFSTSLSKVSFNSKGETLKIPIYIIDAFTDKRFSGNPAAVCPLSEWLEDDVLQSIASENNLSETAFFVRDEGIFNLRWFTPEVEVDLCGHATLASAYVIFKHLKYEHSEIVFETKSGRLTVKKDNNILLMEFPALETSPIEVPEILTQCLGIKPKEVLQGSWLYMAVFENEGEIKKISPDFSLMKKLDKDVVVTAKGNDSADFVSRCFAPSVGIPEDPVTGSSHCALVPYWSEKLMKSKFKALQLSKRSGELYCEYLGDKVIIGGKAVTYSVGRIILEDE